ncbi:MAG: AMP-binding protein, partial [Alistipes sp.]|nr:AMP-binding protein [Alistipes sp.]
IIDGYQYRIDSSNPAHLAGELLVKGPSVFAGYYKNPEATAAAFTQDGFFRTGDLGMADADGLLFLVGRCKSMLLSTNGQNIFPEEIEVILNTMPYVGESLVVQRQNTLVALVVPNIDKVANDHMSAETLQEVMQHNLEELNRRLPAYSQVAEFELQHDPFAKTPKGSIKRFLYA